MAKKKSQDETEKKAVNEDLKNEKETLHQEQENPGNSSEELKDSGEIEFDIDENEEEQNSPGEEGSELEKAKQELGELKGNHIRLMAEFDNFRKRTQREKSELIRYGSEDLMKALLPILDNFDRTQEAMEQSDNLESLLEGIRLVRKNMRELLEKKGLSEIEAKDEEFDSQLHEAITTVPVPDEKQKGMVIDQVEKGYKLHDKVIRYSKVVVGE